MSKSDGHFITRRRQKRLRRTTAGWGLLIKWKDPTESWVKLADMKASHPVKVTKYVWSRDIHKEQAFGMVGSPYI